MCNLTHILNHRAVLSRNGCHFRYPFIFSSSPLQAFYVVDVSVKRGAKCIVFFKVSTPKSMVSLGVTVYGSGYDSQFNSCATDYLGEVSAINDHISRRCFQIEYLFQELKG